MTTRNQRGELSLGAIVALVVAALIVLPLLFFGARVALAPLFGAGNARIINNTGENRIAQYNHFFNLCASVQTAEGQLEVQSSLKDTLPADQYATNVAAIQSSRLELINQYNADARKQATAGEFRASDLPYQINANDANTECK